MSELVILPITLILWLSLMGLWDFSSKRIAKNQKEEYKKVREKEVADVERVALLVLTVEEIAHCYEIGVLPIEHEFVSWPKELYDARTQGLEDPGHIQYRLKIGEYAYRQD